MLAPVSSISTKSDLTHMRRRLPLAWEAGDPDYWGSHFSLNCSSAAVADPKARGVRESRCLQGAPESLLAALRMGL